MKKAHYIVGLIVSMIFIIVGSFSLLSAAPAAKKQNNITNLIKIEGKIIKNEHGNKNGIVTIKTNKNNVTLFYAFGKFKIIGAEYFEQGDDVTASYKPTGSLDFEGDLVSISIKNKK